MRHIFKTQKLQKMLQELTQLFNLLEERIDPAASSKDMLKKITQDPGPRRSPISKKEDKT